MNKGWKVFDKDLRCGGFQFEVGKSYTHEGPIKLCRAGFNFHTKACYLFNYYCYSPDIRVCEIAFDSENVQHCRDKSVTGKIEILRELSRDEILLLVNEDKAISFHNL